MKTTKMLTILVLALGLMVCSVQVSQAAPMGTAFTYQGHLYDNSVADDFYDFQFKLYDANVGGSKAANDVNVADVDVIDGYFTVVLDFNDANAFNGDARFLEIGVRPGDQNDPCSYEVLLPRQEVTPTLYAVQTRGIFVDDSGNVNVDGNIKALGFGVGSTTAYRDGWIRVFGNPTNEFVFKSGGGKPISSTTEGVELMRLTGFTEGGNLGIGTASPQNKLDVEGAIAVGSTYSGTNTAPTNGMIIEGNVGIGTTTPTPAAKLHVMASGTGGVRIQRDGEVQYQINAYGNNAYPLLSSTRGRGTAASPQVVQNNDLLFGINADGHYQQLGSATGAALYFYANENWDSSNMGSRIVFNGISDGLTLMSEWMRLENGKVGIGTANPTQRLDVAGQTRIRILSAGDFNDVVVADSDGVLYTRDASTLGGAADNDWAWSSGSGLTGDIYHNGNVGIGTTSPAAKLTVNGAILREGSTMFGTSANTHINLGMNSDTGALGFNLPGCTVGGGLVNIASGRYATVGGGIENTASGDRSTVPGGFLNTAGGMYSFAAGRKAKANHNGSFVWADATGPAFASTASNQFLIRASGGVGIGTTNPAYDLDVNGDIRAIGSVYYGGTEGNANGTAYIKPDYVFEEGYDVMSIEQVEEYLKEENHLPWMTSVKTEKEENGDVVDMTRMAFETVETAENLQIQVIEQNKLIKEQQKKITALEGRLEALEKMMGQRFAVAKEVQR